jgi:hypothetical protein
MGSTGDPSGESSLALYGPVTSSRKRGAGRKVAPAMHGICPALSVICHAQYRSLFRLAVLLTGDAGAAEAVVLDSFAALYRPRKRPPTGDDALPHLRRLLVARSRLARHHHLWDGSRRPRSGGGAARCISTPHKARHLARARLAPRTVLPSTPEYQPHPRPAALAGRPVPAADLG